MRPFTAARRRQSCFEKSLQADYTLFDSVNLKEFLETGRSDSSESACESMLGTTLKISYNDVTDQWTFKYSLGLGLTIVFRPHIPQSHMSWYGHDVMSSFEVRDNYWLEDERCFEGPITANTDWRLSDSGEILIITTRWETISNETREDKKNVCIRYYKRKRHLEDMPPIQNKRLPAKRFQFRARSSSSPSRESES